MDNTFQFFKGRVALFAILRAICIREGDEVILPGFTCVVVPNAIQYLKVKPVYVDINPETFNIDPKSIEEKITPKTRAIIVQHTFGIPAEMETIVEIARKHSLYIVEDCCHALGSRYKGHEVGTFGDAAFFSSQWSKPVTTGLGGWAVVNSEELQKSMERILPEFIQPSFQESAELMLQYLVYSMLFRPSLFWTIQEAYRWLSRAGLAIGSSSNEELECAMPAGYEKKMSRWQCKLLKRKLMKIDGVSRHRKWVVSLYEKFLDEKGIKTVKLSEDYEPVFLRYPVLVEDKKKIMEEAKKKRIEMGDWFLSPVHPNRSRLDRVSYREGICPTAEKICREIINLPTHERIHEEEVEKAVELISDAGR